MNKTNNGVMKTNGVSYFLKSGLNCSSGPWENPVQEKKFYLYGNIASSFSGYQGWG